MLNQRTLKNSIRATGVGLHTGKKVLMTLRPALPDTGIVFRRTDLDQPVDIRAHAENVGDTSMNTTLPNPLAPTNLIAFLWDDLDLSSGGRVYAFSDPIAGALRPVTCEIVIAIWREDAGVNVAITIVPEWVVVAIAPQGVVRDVVIGERPE